MSGPSSTSRGAYASPSRRRSQPNNLHAIYGLYLSDQLDVILYAGSWRVATLDERLRQHREGECRTTAKMAAKQGLGTDALQMRVLAYWMSGAEPSPEGKMVLALQAGGQCRWNHPYAMSTEDNRRGARNIPHEARVRGGHIGGHISMAKMSPEDRGRAARIGGRMGSHEDKVRAGRIGGQNVSREDHARAGRSNSRGHHARAGRIGACTRWHADQPKVDRLCVECTAKEQFAQIGNPFPFNLPRPAQPALFR